MVVFLSSTHRIIDEIENIIKTAKSDVYLVSPYNSLLGTTETAIRNRNGIKFHFIYGNQTPKKKGDGQKSKTQGGTQTNNVEVSYLDANMKKTIHWIQNLPSYELLYRRYLHAKCYMNETDVVVTSMNLLDSSVNNNDEMGFLLSIKDDSELFDKIQKYVWELRDNSRNHTKLSIPKIEKDIACCIEEAPRSGGTRVIGQYADQPSLGQRLFKFGVAFKDGLIQVGDNLTSNLGPITAVPDDEPAKKSERKTTARTIKTYDGHCLRCNAVIKYNLKKPYCTKDYNIWEKYSNPDYKEKYCHKCGGAFSSSMSTPLCKNCRTK